MAKGRIDDAQLQALEGLLRKSITDEERGGPTRVRAVVVHHSPSYSGGLAKKMELDPQSRARLWTISARNRCFTLLTGHVHSFLEHAEQVDLNGKHRTVFELRCPTTFQEPPKPKHQGFLLHRIQLSDDAIQWLVWVYRWHGSRFERNHDQPDHTLP